jgi:hypothetical protein
MTDERTAPGELTGAAWEGTWDEIRAHAESLPDLRFRLEVLGPAAETKAESTRREPSGFGRFAGLLSSDDVIRNKREDLELDLELEEQHR